MSDAPAAAAGTSSALPLEAIRALVGALPDPEIPVVTLADLGILRDVSIEAGVPVVTLTPTYSGCPATEAIVAQVRATLEHAGHADAQVRIALAPAWTTDWITEPARRRLRAFGIAPPACAAGAVVQPLRFIARAAEAAPRCPRCDAADVEELARHGSTPCKALWRCRACGEPFDYFKPY